MNDGRQAMTPRIARWDATARWWNAAFCCVIALSIALAARNAYEFTDVGLAWELAALAVLSAAYFVIGIPGLKNADPRRCGVYLTILIIVVGITGTQAPSVVNPLLVIGFSHCWLFVQGAKVPGIFATIALAATVTFGLWAANDFSTSWLLGYLPVFALVVGFSSMIGLGFAHSELMSRRNAVFADELAAAQESLARAQFEAGLTTERMRVAREVHDTLAQGFSTLSIFAQLAEMNVRAEEYQEALSRLTQMREIAATNLAEARSIISNQGPVLLKDTSSACDALRTLVYTFGRQAGIATEAVIDDVVLPPQVAQVLVRATQEALTNVRRHANASLVIVSLGLSSTEQAVLSVADDGRGLAATHKRGYGLTGMHDRLQEIGGSVVASDTDGGGLTLTMTIPLPVKASKG